MSLPEKIAASENDMAEEFLAHFPGQQILIAMPEFNKAPTHWRSSYLKVKEFLLERNKTDGIFFTVNELDPNLDPGRKRTKKMWTRSRAVFMDADIPRDKPRDNFPLEPSIIVSSSPGKYHYYWLTDTDDKEAWQAVQNGIIQTYEGDNNAKDLTRYLRLPGYYHWKDKSNPHLVTYTGRGRVYGWQEIVDAFPPQVEQRSAPSSTQSGESKSVSKSEAEISSGENFHGNLLSLSHQMKQEGIPDRYIILTLQGLMNQCSSEIKETDRWKSRYDDIERLVTEDEHKEDYEIEFYKKEVANQSIPWPPGQLGLLAKDAYNMANYQYDVVATVSAIGLVAGIAGRKYNIKGMGLNVYLTLLMLTGMGKDSITKFINTSLMDANEVGTASSFIGETRFTGSPSIYNALKDARSQVSVLTEAGLLMKSKAGDTNATTRVLLSAYGRSGTKEYLGSEGRSKTEERLPVLRAVALTLINESTPGTLLEAFSDNNSAERGELPRQSVYRVIGDRPDLDEGAWKRKLSKDNSDRIKYLVNRCSAVQAKADPEAIDLEFGPELAKDVSSYNKSLNREFNKNSDDPVKASMISRAYVKALKFASIAAVFNHPDEIEIQPAEWSWAKAMVEYEIQGLDNFFKTDSADGMTNLIESVLYKPIVRLLEVDKNIKPYGGKHGRLSRIDIQKKRIPLKRIVDRVRHNKSIQALNKRYPNSDAWDLIKIYMKHPDRRWIRTRMINSKEYLVFEKAFWVAMGAKNVK